MENHAFMIIYRIIIIKLALCTQKYKLILKLAIEINLVKRRLNPFIQ